VLRQGNGTRTLDWRVVQNAAAAPIPLDVEALLWVA